MKTLKFVLILAVSVILCIPNVYAYNFGTDITISDARNEGGSGWHGTQEDNEVEPGMQHGQVWDLERFFLNGNKLSIVAGFDLMGGYGGYASGDIFIDTNNDAQYGNSYLGYPNHTNTFGYEYVLDMDYSSYTYSVYLLSGASIDDGGLDPNTNHPASAPYRRGSGGTAVAGYQDVTFGHGNFNPGTDVYTGLLLSSTDAHNALTVDIGFLPGGTDFTSHFTIGCGNDNLMGQGTTAVPEPATLLLLGLGLVGLGVARKFKK